MAKIKPLTREELEDLLGAENGDRLLNLDIVGAAEVAERILGVERARIGKWRRNGILLKTGERIQFPEPITVATSVAGFPNGHKREGKPDLTKLAATPLWWGDDIRRLKQLLKSTGTSR